MVIWKVQDFKETRELIKPWMNLIGEEYVELGIYEKIYKRAEMLKRQKDNHLSDLKRKSWTNLNTLDFI